jgi:hypothetical protein
MRGQEESSLKVDVDVQVDDAPALEAALGPCYAAAVAREAVIIQCCDADGVLAVSSPQGSCLARKLSYGGACCANSECADAESSSCPALVPRVPSVLYKYLKRRGIPSPSGASLLTMLVLGGLWPSLS